MGKQDWKNPGPNMRYCEGCKQYYSQGKVIREGDKASTAKYTVVCTACGTKLILGE